MMIRMIFAAALTLCLSQLAVAEDIQVTLQPIKSSVGNIYYSLYDSADAFMSASNSYQDGSVPPVLGTLQITLSNVTPGFYAMTAFQDLHGDGTFDTGLFGRPTDPFAISNITKTLWSHPQWDDVKFEVIAGQVTELPMLMKMQ